MKTTENKKPDIVAKCLSVRPTMSSEAHCVVKAVTSTALDRRETNTVEWIEPLLPLAGLKELCQTSTILPQCVDAYGANIAGYGVEPVYSVDTSKSGETKEMEAEWDTLKKVLKRLSIDKPITEVFADAIKERERCGIAYIECIRGGDGNIVELFNVRDTEYVRMSHQQAQETEYSIYIDGDKIPRRKRFRRYRQEVNGETVYFKEFGDPREMNRYTGEYTEAGRLTLCDQANELLELAIGSGHYGMVRWIGQVVVVDGSLAAETLNDNYFHNGRHTPLAIILSGGTLTKESEEEIQKYLSEVKGEEGQHKVLLLQVDAKGSITGMEDKEKPSVEIKDLTPMLQQDALFTEYLESNRKKIQSAFRLPDVYLAYTSDYNRSTVYAAMKLADEQVFRRERENLEWLINQKLLSSYGFRYVSVSVKAPELRDADSEDKRFSVCAQHGGLTANMAKEQIAHMTGQAECENYVCDWGDLPLQLIDKINAQATTNSPTRSPTAPTESETEEGQEDVRPLLRAVYKALKGQENQ